MIRRIEGFPLKLHGFRFRDGKRFTQLQVEFVETGATQRIMRHETISTDSLRRYKYCRIEPLVRVRVWHIRIAGRVRPGGVEVGEQQRVIRHLRRKRQPRFESGQTAKYPATR